MDFTRQPIIESIITPREGHKLVIRSSKSSGQEEHFVESVEVVTLGHQLFFRSLERPRPFIVPSNDYEVVEVREARVALKNVGAERPIRTQPVKMVKEPAVEQKQQQQQRQEAAPEPETAAAPSDKRRDRRRGNRRRDREEPMNEAKSAAAPAGENGAAAIVAAASTEEAKAPPPRKTLLPPPPTLISETLARYKDSAMFKDAFYVKEHELPKEHAPTAEAPVSTEQTPSKVHQEDVLEAIEMQNVSLEVPEPTDFDFTEDGETTWPFIFPDDESEKSKSTSKE